MRTNIVLDDELVAEAARLSGIRTKRELVHEALRVFVEIRRRKSLLDLVGQVELAPDYDYKRLRGREGLSSSADALVSSAPHAGRHAASKLRGA